MENEGCNVVVTSFTAFMRSQHVLYLLTTRYYTAHSQIYIVYALCAINETACLNGVLR